MLSLNRQDAGELKEEAPGKVYQLMLGDRA